MGLRVAIAGSGRLGTALVDALLDSTHTPVVVLQDGRKTRGWRRWVYPWLARFLGGDYSLMGRAARHGLPILWLDRMDGAEQDRLRRLSPDVLLVGGFGIILKRGILEVPAIGCINTHSSLLPRHRGPNPFAAVVLAGDAESGVTFHVMDEGIDTGPILSQVAFSVAATDRMMDLYKRSSVLAGEHVVALFDRVECEGLVGTPQTEEGASYEKRIREDDAWIDWNESADYIDRFVRALAPSPMPRFRHRGRVVYVAKADFEATSSSAAPGDVIATRPFPRVATGDGTLIIQAAFSVRPVPWLWPAPWTRPEIGEALH